MLRLPQSTLLCLLTVVEWEICCYLNTEVQFITLLVAEWYGSYVLDFPYVLNDMERADNKHNIIVMFAIWQAISKKQQRYWQCIESMKTNIDMDDFTLLWYQFHGLFTSLVPPEIAIKWPKIASANRDSVGLIYGLVFIISVLCRM